MCLALLSLNPDARRHDSLHLLRAVRIYQHGRSFGWTAVMVAFCCSMCESQSQMLSGRHVSRPVQTNRHRNYHISLLFTIKE